MVDIFFWICLSFGTSKFAKIQLVIGKTYENSSLVYSKSRLRLRIATAVTLIFAAAAMGVLRGPPLASSRSPPARRLFLQAKALPPKRNLNCPRRTATLAAGSPWQLLTNQPPVLDYFDCGPGNPILLTDGTVMLADNGCQDWWKLTPDEFGSYVNGTWTQLASLPDGYSPLYHSSAVLPDGRLIIEGGEYIFSNGVFTQSGSDQGAIYDPLANTWTLVAPPPFLGLWAFSENDRRCPKCGSLRRNLHAGQLLH